MNLKDINIISISIGKKVEIKYDVLKEDRIYTAEDDEIPHPGFTEALSAFIPDFATAFEKLEDKSFKVTGISFSSEDGGFYVALKGKIETKYGESVGVTSGKIPVVEDTKIAQKIATIREEAYQYLFLGKAAQKKIEFEEKAE